MTDVMVKNYDGEDVGEVALHQLARSLSPENFAELIDDYLNLGGKQMPEGVKIGTDLRNTHRTLQRLVICFCLGVLYGISDQEYTDLRNGQAIETAKKIKQMIDNGELPVGGYV